MNIQVCVEYIVLFSGDDFAPASGRNASNLVTTYVLIRETVLNKSAAGGGKGAGERELHTLVVQFSQMDTSLITICSSFFH